MNQAKNLRALVQLVPAVVVAAVIALTLPHTEPVLAAVPERLAAVQPAEEPTVPAASEAEEEDTLPKLPYEDGVYTGSSRGYGGKVKVQVTMEGGHITDLQILDASHETSNFLKRARRLLPTVLEAQTWEVDAVSEATYTSRGILGAIQNALTGEEVINPAPPQPKPAEPLVVEEFVAPSAYRDGVYTASAEGFGGPITVQVTISDGVLADITLGDHSGETSSYFSRARAVIPTILESGSPEGVDSVSGATYSSTGILNAVKLALAKAANDPDAAPEAAETPAESDAESIPEETAPASEAASSEAAQPEEAASSTQSTAADFWNQTKDWLRSLFADDAEDEAPAASAPDVVFRAADPEPASQPAEEPTESAAAEPTETEASAQ